MPTADGSMSEAPSAAKNAKHRSGKRKAKKLVKVIKLLQSITVHYHARISFSPSWHTLETLAQKSSVAAWSSTLREYKAMEEKLPNNISKCFKCSKHKTMVDNQ